MFLLLRIWGRLTNLPEPDPAAGVNDSQLCSNNRNEMKIGYTEDFGLFNQLAYGETRNIVITEKS